MTILGGEFVWWDGTKAQLVKPHEWDGITLRLLEVYGLIGEDSSTGARITAPVAELPTGFWLHTRGNPEETLPTYRAAAKSNIGIAPSLRLLVDAATLVANHDLTVDRTWKPGTGTGNVSALSIAQWQNGVVVDTLAEGKPPAPAMFWSELVSEFGGRAVIAPEARTPESVARIISSVQNRGLQAWTIFRTWTRAQAAQAATAGLFAMWQQTLAPTDWAAIAAEGIWAVALPPNAITVTVVNTARSAGVQLWAHGVNDVTQRDAVNAAGVDGILSRYADKLALSQPPVSSGRLVVGAAIGSNDDPATTLEQQMGGLRLMGHRTYGSTSTQITQITNYAKDDWAKGRIPYVSIKPPNIATVGVGGAWKAVGNGSEDVWINSLLDSLQNAAVAAGPGRTVELCVHHEPDDEILEGQATAADFVAMSTRIADRALLRSRVRFGVVLMGFHSFGSNNLPINTVVPEALAKKLKFFGVDIYENYDKAGGTTWTPFDTRYGQINAWRKSVNPGMAWGQYETGITARAFSLRPDWFREQVRLMKKHEGTVWLYFSSGLNSVASWPLEGDRLTAFTEILRAEREGWAPW